MENGIARLDNAQPNAAPGEIPITKHLTVNNTTSKDNAIMFLRKELLIRIVLTLQYRYSTSSYKY